MLNATSLKHKTPRFLVEPAREEEYVIRLGAVRARRPLMKLTAAQRIELLETARRHLAALDEQIGEEIAMLETA